MTDETESAEMGSGIEIEPCNPGQLAGDPPGLLHKFRRNRMALRLSIIGWMQLFVFWVCEGLFLGGDRSAAHFLPLWGLDVALTAIVLIPAIISGTARGERRSGQILVRVWLTFAILSLTSASLNSITGFTIDWFKISWAMLGTFGFATLAWVFHLAFLIPAVGMSVTALLIASHPDHAYLIFGVSWCLTLQSLAAWLEFGHLSARLTSRAPLVVRRMSSEVEADARWSDRSRVG